MRKTMKEHKFKFSVIIPVYKVEAYLEETVESVIAQTIGFQENIQIILVNDGSPDNSGEICERYKSLYPDNVEYVVQENAGVSAARNTGIPYAKGKYINFLDSDDKWSEDAFEIAYQFFEENYDEIDVVAARIRFFDAKTDFHVLDYKFYQGDRVADIKEPENSNLIQLHVSSAFIKREVISDKHRFQAGIKYGEDGLFITPIILEKGAYGLLKSCLFYYRRRPDLSSAVQSQRHDADFYLTCPKAYYFGIINKSVELYGRVIEYVQQIVCYDLGWHLNQDLTKVLDEAGQAEAKEIAKKALSFVDDDIIINNRIHQDIYRKRVAYNLKHDGDDLFKRFCLDKEEGTMYFGDYTVAGLKRSHSVLHIKIFDYTNKTAVIMGHIASWLVNSTENGGTLYFKAGKKKYPAELSEYTHNVFQSYIGPMDRYYSFSCKIPIDKLFGDKELLRVFPIIKFGEDQCRLGMQYGKFVPSCNSFSESYSIVNNRLIRFFRTVIKLYRYDSLSKLRRNRAKQELKVLSALRKCKRKDMARLRIRYFLNKKKFTEKGKIWLISDRIDNADDNGEAFFKYMCRVKPEGIRPIFVISESAACVDRLKEIGEVVFVEDKDYPLYFLYAEKIISSSAGEFTINPFGADRRYVGDLFRFKFYFLQHGVICTDLSSWLHKFNKNIDKFITSGKKEYQSILNYDYGYESEQVALTGLARFDELQDETKKQILILPTWRRAIRESYDKNTKSVYFDGFRETDFYKHYNSLINDERLLAVMRKHGYTGVLCLHPIQTEQWVDFVGNDVFSVNEGYVDYRKIFSESAAVVTDYSSALFDMAYLRKAVIYSQFDKKEFFEQQIFDEGYFSYEDDGFGPVCYDYESTVDAIIEYVENDCKNPQKYIDRVNAFFEFSDKNNCERIYNAIIGEE